MRGDMGTVTGIEAAAAAQPLSGQWLIAAFYINELLVRLLHQHESHPELFAAYEQALHDLSGMRPEEPTLRVFEKHLLLSLGYGLVLDHDFQTGLPIEPDTTYFYVLDRGPSRETANRNDDVRISGSSLLALQSESLTDTAQIQECKHLMRAMLSVQLGARPLASRKLYRQLVANRTSN
jgi:DNA repair protein RecO (recombination protein O)